MTTLKDLSRHLGLSITQVSRALNGYPDVSKKTRDRVMEAADLLNYTPNIAARNLVSGRSGVVGFISRNLPGIAKNTIFFETVTGLSEAFSARDVQFVLHLTPETDTGDIIPVYDRLFRGGTLDGFVLVDPLPEDLRIQHLLTHKVPFVVHGRGEMEPPYPYVDVDNRGLAYRMASHLTALGHRRIALISGPEPLAFCRFRLAGFRRALAEAGLEENPAHIRHGFMTEALGLTATIQMFGDPARAPTAIVCGNTLVSKGVYQALGSLSLRVPEDVSVIAHDDAILAASPESFAPALTVTRSPLADSWAPLADTLIGAINRKPIGTLQKIIPFDFIERASTAPPPA
ncbi:substrate-binding domain-containing protein [Rhodobacteraceae bacterium DSL-40]|uniref:LacI family DNA-binding transcriptional regulator n=1 Tax=Amaricoccus sp. B4 TaxID=3368557 RepID=UPI000DACDEF0